MQSSNDEYPIDSPTAAGSVLEDVFCFIEVDDGFVKLLLVDMFDALGIEHVDPL